MRQVCIVPTWNRSDMLFCTIEAIQAADPELPIHIFPDRGSDEREVCSRFQNVEHHRTLAHSYHGNSFNNLEALKWAYKHQYEMVFIIEDDAIVDPTFFDWCREAFIRNPNIFAACGWQFSPDSPKPHDGPDYIIPWYLSVAAAIPRKSLYSIVQHACIDYYADMKSYLDLAYPASNRRRSNHYEQDGLTLRVMEAESKFCAWPRRPRVTHIGFRGYHMTDGHEIPGSLDERVAVIKLLMKNPQMLRGMMNGGKPPEVARCRDCQKPLLSNEKATLVCVDCFHKVYPNLPRTSSSHYYLPPTLLCKEQESHIAGNP